MATNAANIEQACTAFAERVTSPAEGRTAARSTCFHCGLLCPAACFVSQSRTFCCQGCLTVFELLTENGLKAFYEFADKPGVRGGGVSGASEYGFVDAPAVRARLVDYADAQQTRVRLHLPAIHCIACVWLLENLFRLRAGIGHSEVNFVRKEVAITFETNELKLSEVLGLVHSLGYEPELKLVDLTPARPRLSRHALWLQLGIAGFAFGNTMLFSIASYLGLDSATGPGFRKLVGALSLILALPVVTYSARDYWRSAWISVQQRLLNIDVPIVLGLLALYLQSAFSVLAGRGDGYFDSLSGLVFFLLCGRLFQQKTFECMVFDRDYRSFFPLSVARQAGTEEERVALSELQLGDQLVIRNGELIPADSRVVTGQALIDYSFVTGESNPVSRVEGEYLYAGGRHLGAVIKVETVKPVSQGYLTSLWEQESFRKRGESEVLEHLTNRFSQRFTKIVIGIAVGAAAFWGVVRPALALKAFTSVLIVACPCALALAAPFSLGTALRVLARRKVYLKNTGILECLAGADAVVFDKTGTLTVSSSNPVFRGVALGHEERVWMRALAWQSNHPLASRLRQSLADADDPAPVSLFQEYPGAGMEGDVAGHCLRMGSAKWFQQLGIHVSSSADASHCLQGNPGGDLPVCGSVVHLAIDGTYRGALDFTAEFRPGLERLVGRLRPRYELALVSGDNSRERARFTQLFGPSADLRFDQSPLDKLKFVQDLQREGRTVVMVGDGLNDAGALKQSDVGIAVVENVSAFSPASDAIITAENVPQLGEVLRFARAAVRVVRASFIISSLYNVIGISIAARGLLAPVVCAVLMPLSSVTVVAFACGVTHLVGRRLLARQGCT